MIPFSLQQLAEVTQGELVLTSGSCQDIMIEGVTTDTRAINDGALFVALIGERFDGHQFAVEAVEQGAKALLVSKRLEVNVTQILVKDTLVALGQLAAWLHQQSKVTTLALTGSCGKTTVKEMLNAILSQEGKVLCTAGNFNNDIGVPLTLLRRALDDDYAVIELGANHIGEIAYTTNLVKPDVALVNNVAAAHLEGFGSLEGVATAKGEIFQGLPEHGIAVVNLDSNGLSQWQNNLKDKKVVTFSATQSTYSSATQCADFYAEQIEIDQLGHARFQLVTPQGSAWVSLPMIGEHNVANALAAAAMATQVGVSLERIVSGLQTPTQVKGRVEAIELASNIRLIDDSYNASVPAMKAAVDLLARYSGKRWLILGFMAELGSESAQLHRQIGEHAAQFNFDYVLTFGDDTEIISQLCQVNEELSNQEQRNNGIKIKTCGQHFTNHDTMVDFIRQHLAEDITQQHTLLVKGANSARMSRIVASLKETYS